MNRIYTVIILLFGTHFLNAQNVGIATNSPMSTLEVNGSLGAKVTTITSNTTLTSGEAIVLCNSASNFTVTLPTAAGIVGRMYTIKNINTGIVTIATSAGQTIDGLSNKQLTSIYTSVELISNGTNWNILNDVNAKPPVFLFATDAAVGNNNYIGMGTSSSIYERNTIVVPFNCELTSIGFSIRDFQFNNFITATVWKNNMPTALSVMIVDGFTTIWAVAQGSVFVMQGDLITIRINWDIGGVLSDGIAASVTYR